MLQALEVTYLRCLCFAGLPMLVMAAVNGFFSGRGQTWPEHGRTELRAPEGESEAASGQLAGTTASGVMPVLSKIR